MSIVEAYPDHHPSLFSPRSSSYRYNVSNDKGMMPGDLCNEIEVTLIRGWTFPTACSKVLDYYGINSSRGGAWLILDSIQKKIISFRNERDWAQFHDPKNLAEALTIEAGELLENFLWKTTAVPQPYRNKLENLLMFPYG